MNYKRAIKMVFIGLAVSTICCVHQGLRSAQPPRGRPEGFPDLEGQVQRIGQVVENVKNKLRNSEQERALVSDYARVAQAIFGQAIGALPAEFKGGQ